MVASSLLARREFVESDRRGLWRSDIPMRAHHWDWLHVITVALALVALADSDRRTVSAARVLQWPVAHGIVTKSAIDTFYITFVARHGRVFAHRRIATYAFDVGGRTYGGTTLSWYPLSDAQRLGAGASLAVHFDRGNPNRNAVFAPPSFIVWVEALAGIVLMLISAIPSSRGTRYSKFDDDGAGTVIVLHVPTSSQPHT